MKYSALFLSTALAALSATAQEKKDSVPEDDYTNLQELVITTQKKVVKSDGAKLTYDMDEDTSSKGQSVLDALKKVPMVTVDGQDQIRVQGSTGFKIYVNGKEEPMLTANAAQILKSMPAEAVSKIEVITEPGAKYDAEGTGGIINLITERTQRKDGYTATISANLGAANVGAGAYGRMKYGNVTADANFNYANNGLRKQTQYTEQNSYNYESDEAYHLHSTMKQKFGFDYYGGNVNLSWEPSKTDLFTFAGNVYGIKAGLHNLAFQSETFSRAGNIVQEYSQNMNGDLSNIGASGNVGYKHQFNEKGHNLQMAYAFNYGKSGMTLNYHTLPGLNTDMLPDYSKNSTTDYTREHTATVDYTNPLDGGKHTLEAGLKGIFRRNNANSGEYLGDDPASLIPVEDNTSVTRQIQDIYAAYLSYSATFGKIAVKAGLRYEHTFMGMDFLNGEMPDYRRHLNDVVPNAALTWMFGPATNLRLAYQMRISRPGLSQMNPYRFQIIQNEVRMGNPDLESERHNKITLTYSNYGRIFGGNISLDASQANNTIEEYSYFEGNTRFQTYENMGHKQRMALTGFLNANLSNNFSVGVNGTVHYTRITSPANHLSNHGWNGEYGANINYTAPANIKISAYGGHSTGDIHLQGRFYGWYYYGVGFTRGFLKDEALKLTLNTQNFLTKYTHFHGYTRTDSNYLSFRNKSVNWNVSLSISWTFGKLSDQVKKTGGNIKNDDQVAGNKKDGIGL